MSNLFILLAVFGLAVAGIDRRRRDNSYGDESVTPAGGGASVGSDAPEIAPATVAPEVAGAPAAVETSGYRKKRAVSQNAYGDEAATPAGGGAPAPSVSEAPAVTVAQSGGDHSDVASSGY